MREGRAHPEGALFFFSFCLSAMRCLFLCLFLCLFSPSLVFSFVSSFGVQEAGVLVVEVKYLYPGLQG